MSDDPKTIATRVLDATRMAEAAARSGRILDAMTALVEHPCPQCDGTGGVDTGGVTPWGGSITDQCPACKGTGKDAPC